MPTLRRAGAAEEAERDRLSHAEWAGGLSLDDHLARERALRASAWSRAAHTMWLWEEGGAVLASCETYAVRSAIGGVPGVTYEIASVFTEEHHRGRGHASRLLDALAAAHAAPDLQAFLLFSDVGEAMYARLGFEGLPAWDRVATPLRASPAPGLVPLTAATLDAAWSAAARLGDGAPGGGARPDGPTGGDPGRGAAPAPPPFTLHPSAAQLHWHLDEARLSAALAGRPNLPTCGARLGDAVIVWALDPRADELLVLDLVADAAEAGPLWAAARDAAADAGLTAVRAWETADWPGLGGRVAREGHVPMIRPMAAFEAATFDRVPRGLWV